MGYGDNGDHVDINKKVEVFSEVVVHEVASEMDYVQNYQLQVNSDH